MQIINTGSPQAKPSIVMLIYGEGGVGKTTFSSTAPKPVLADCENGAKYFGLRGIKMDVAKIQSWEDMNFSDGFGALAIKSGDYQTVIIDPIGELMEKLKMYMVNKNERKLVQNDGTPSIAGWGWLKDTMRSYLKVLRDSGKHVLLIAHLDEKPDEDRLVKRPMLQTKLSDELVNMVDIVGYMTVVNKDGKDKRIIVVDPSSDKITVKDRTGQLGKIIEPNFSKIVKAVQGTKAYSWSKGVIFASKKKNSKKVASVKAKLKKANKKNDK